MDSNIPFDTLRRLAPAGLNIIPVVLSQGTAQPLLAYLEFDTQESQRFPGRIWIKLVEEKDA